jgi:hypothetical protein
MLDWMASLRVRQRKDGGSYTAVLYTLDNKQSSSSFNDHREAIAFQQLVNLSTAGQPGWPGQGRRELAHPAAH